MIAVLVASALFLLLFNLGSALAALVWLGCIVFLPVGVWLGRESPRPWLDGAVYGLVASLVVAVILFTSGFAMGSWGAIGAFLLVLPQALFGAWLGGRFPAHR